MKKILLPLALCFTVAGSAFAASAVTEKKVELSYKYPVISGMENTVAEAAINATLKEALLELRDDQGEDEYIVSGGLMYEMGAETDKHLSLILKSYDYHGGAHGMYYTEGYVFDKTTGKRLAYTDFVPELTADALRRGLRAELLQGVTADGSVSPLPFMDEKTRLSKNFILNEDGSISLIYDPYEVDCYAAGNVFVRLTPELVRKVQRLR